MASPSIGRSGDAFHEGEPGIASRQSALLSHFTVFRGFLEANA